MSAAPAASSALGLLLGLGLAPLAGGLVARVKSIMAGRRGPPLHQGWIDVVRLLRKGEVTSEAATWVFHAGPIVGLAAVLTALALVPWTGAAALLAFPGDLVLVALLFALMRFVTVLAALDTGSSFEGMGASREAAFSVLVEPALLLGLATLARGTGSWSLSGMLGPPAGRAWPIMGPALGLLVVTLFVLLLCENSRIPVDDPNTHLELTMIHEVMVLDHSGPGLAFLEYAAALKLWLFEALLVGLLLPFRTGSLAGDIAVFLSGMAIVSVAVGLVESSMARLQLPRVPQLLLGATVLSGFSLILTMR